jgi:D-alanyl-D-alanine carboxypeptidase
MSDVDLAPVADAAASRSVDRRTLLLGAAGAVAAAGLPWPARAAGHATSRAAASGPRFDPGLARQLQRALRDALGDPSTHAPGAILHVQSPKLGRWTGVAGLGRVAPDVRMRPGDAFRAGSIVKPFVAVVVLQLAEGGRLSLDARMPEVLRADVAGRFANAADITVRMLLGHRAGIPDWDSPALDEQVARDQAKVWTVAEFLDLAAAKPPVFAPGTSFSYSNTDYTLLSLVIERITGRSWRHEVAGRVLRPLRLTHTHLPAPGQRSIERRHAHGYVEVDGKLVDVNLDPAFAGAAGGYALLTRATRR